MSRIVYSINRRIALLGGAGMVALMVLVVTDVTRRYLMNSPLRWSLEINEYLLVFIAFLGISYTLQDHGHVSIDVIYRRYSERMKRICDFIRAVIILGLSGLLSWQSLATALFYLKRGITSDTLLKTPLFYPMLPVVLGTILLGVTSLLMLYEVVLSSKEKTGASSHTGTGEER